MKWFFIVCCFGISVAPAQENTLVTKRDQRRDIKMTTSLGVIVFRLNDSTTLHRDNFLKLVKSHYLDSTLFHRVINHFVIQGGDPDSRHSKPGQELGNGGPSYTIPAEFHDHLFHERGAVGAAREDNPAKASSGSQFYIVQGKIYSDAGLDSLEKSTGRKISGEKRAIYKSIGGLPKLDQRYTVFGYVVKGMDVVDKIERVATDKLDRPVQDVRILKIRLVRRKKKYKLPVWFQ